VFCPVTAALFARLRVQNTRARRLHMHTVHGIVSNIRFQYKIAMPFTSSSNMKTWRQIFTDTSTALTLAKNLARGLGARINEPKTHNDCRLNVIMFV